MSKFTYIVFILILSSIIITELFIYSYVTKNGSVKERISSGNEVSYSDNYISELKTLLMFYSSIEEPAFTEGTMSTQFIGFARNIKEKDNMLTLSLCDAVNNSDKCSPFNLQVDKNLKFINSKNIAENDNLKIEMEYRFLEKHFNTTISKLN